MAMTIAKEDIKNRYIHHEQWRKLREELNKVDTFERFDTELKEAQCNEVVRKEMTGTKAPANQHMTNWYWGLLRRLAHVIQDLDDVKLNEKPWERKLVWRAWINSMYMDCHHPTQASHGARLRRVTARSCTCNWSPI